MKRKRPPKVYGVVRGNGVPPVKVTNETIAAFIASQEAEIHRLQSELDALKSQQPSLIVLPGGKPN